ncbi:hypothetical protein Zmor_018190 [Zophobas morio]|uniref:Tetratricopeptide repeat protein 12 n=1 Tax=Zophobas morio TaxID=2755281 RepID=A0AA38MCU2_9CUCU|nr:hypothetical protein Zmor_018190 [Zophobas morio]
MSTDDSEPFSEEFNNFMYKVNQVSSIIHKLASNEKNVQEIGELEAKHYLGESNEEKSVILNEDTIDIKIKNDRTVINRKALLREDNPETQSTETFMEEVSKDADRRYKNKLRRREKMETFKKQATLAFRRGEYEKALSLYDKAIEQIRDSCILYSNRALTYINLKHYDKAIKDCETALQLNENSLRARLLLAKAYYFSGKMNNFQKTVEEAKETNVSELSFINDFVKNLTTECEESTERN